VFIFVTNTLGNNWTAEASRIVTKAGMVPFFYQGLDRNLIGSSISNEAQSDLWECDAIIVAVTEEELEKPHELWIYEHVDVAGRRGIPILVYAKKAQRNIHLDARWLTAASTVPVTMVTDENDFGLRLQAALRTLAR